MASFFMAGVRSLAYVHKGDCHLISRNGNQFKSFPALAESLPAELRTRSAVLDGEIVALDRHGKTQFRDLLFRRGDSRFYLFWIPRATFWHKWGYLLDATERKM